LIQKKLNVEYNIHVSSDNQRRLCFILKILVSFIPRMTLRINIRQTTQYRHIKCFPSYDPQSSQHIPFTNLISESMSTTTI